MANKKCWIKNKFGWGNKKGGWVYIYSKGSFRDKENQVVVSTSLTGGSNPADRINKGFETKTEAIRYAKSFMRKNTC